jgi:hypothetical protein
MYTAEKKPRVSLSCPVRLRSTHELRVRDRANEFWHAPGNQSSLENTNGIYPTFSWRNDFCTWVKSLESIFWMF